MIFSYSFCNIVFAILNFGIVISAIIVVGGIVNVTIPTIIMT